MAKATARRATTTVTMKMLQQDATTRTMLNDVNGQRTR
jgi:hypothetical protein